MERSMRDILLQHYIPENIVLSPLFRDVCDEIRPEKLKTNTYIVFCHFIYKKNWDLVLKPQLLSPNRFWNLFQGLVKEALSCVDSENDLILFIQRVMFEQFEKEHGKLDIRSISYGQVIPDFVRKASNIGIDLSAKFFTSVSVALNAVNDAKKATVDWIWDMIQKAFRAALGSHYEILLGMASWIKDIWLRFKTWCNNMIEQQALWAKGIQDCFVLAMGLIGISCVLNLLEKLMINSGLISYKVNLSSTFLLCYMSYLGLKHGGSFVHEKGMQMYSKLMAGISHVLEAVSHLMGNGVEIGADASEEDILDNIGDVSEGQLLNINLLETFANTISGLSSDSVVKTGRFFNAFSQISSGGKAIWCCIQKICGFLWELLDKCFGIKSKVLADLSVMVGHDVQGWLRKCDAACEYMNLYPAIPQDILKNIKNVQAKGREIRDCLLKRPDRGSMMALTTVNKAMERLGQLLEAAILSGKMGARKEPFWVAFVGSAGVGKSTVMSMLTKRFLLDNELDPMDSYPRNTTDPFWSRYRRQSVVTYDDLGALSSPTLTEEAELFKLVSRDAVTLNMANLEEKGMSFDSQLIISTSNFYSHNPLGNIHDSTAYQRRRSILVGVEHKLMDDGSKMEMCPDNPVGHHVYTVYKSIEPFIALQRFDNFEDLYAYFKSLYDAHELKESKMMANLRPPEQTLDKSIGLLGELTRSLMTQIMPDSISSWLKRKHSDKLLMAIYQGVAYLVDADMKLTRDEDLKGIDTGDLNDFQGYALTTAMKYEGILRSIPSLNPVAMHFMADLVQKHVFNVDLTIRKGVQSEDDDLYQVAIEIKDWERALIYILSEYMSDGKKGFFSSLYDGLAVQLQKVYVSEIGNWPLIVKLGLGIALVLILGKSLFWTLGYLGAIESTTAMSLAAAKIFVTGQNSDHEVSRKTLEYKHRNVPIRARHWSQGQNYGVGYQWLMKHCLASIQCGSLEGQVVMLPGKKMVGVMHLMRKLPDKAMVKIMMDQQSYFVNWKADCLQALDDSELCVYSHPTLRDVAKSVSDRIVFGIDTLPENFKAVFCSCKLNELTGDYEPEVANLVVSKRNHALTVMAGQYQRFIPSCLEYKAPTVNKDCGSLIIAKIGGVDKLVGIHVAGLNGYGQACFLPSDLQVSEAQNWFDDCFDAFPYEEQVGNGISVVGLLKPDYIVHTPAKTAYEKVPDDWNLGVPCDKEPAILSKDDSRLQGTKNEGYDPYRKGMDKYSQEAGPFDQDCLNSVCDEIVEEWFDCSDGFTFEECSMEEAINGIAGEDYLDPLVMGTSEGFPYILSRERGDKGKSRFFNEGPNGPVPTSFMEQEIQKMELESLNGVPVLVGIEHAKDEKLPLSKIYDEPKTRLFTVMPMHYNLVVRRKFLRFVKFLMQNRRTLTCQVGVNPYGREWGRIADHLLSKGEDILCCDYSRFDGIIPKSVMINISIMINKICKGSDELQRQRTNLLMACCGRFGLCQGKVWRVENGIPSGFPLTVVLNSIFNEIIIRYVFKQSVKDKLLQQCFKNYVSMVVYGDDNLISISPTIQSVFNGSVIQNECAKLSIKITDGVDKQAERLDFRKISCCDFLKRHFVKDEHGRWRAPMEEKSLWSQLHWVKTTHLSSAEAFLVNVESVLRELYLIDINLVKQLRAKILKIDWIEPRMVPNLNQLKEFHETQMGGMDYSIYSSELLLNPTLLGPISHNSMELDDFEVKRLVATASHKYIHKDNDFVISLNMPKVRGVGDNSLILKWDASIGRGELPSSEWLRKCFDGRSEIFKTLKTNYLDGKRIVFVSRLSNVYASIFLVMFGFKAQILDGFESNLILSRAIEVTHSLGYLVDDFANLFFQRNKSRGQNVGNVTIVTGNKGKMLDYRYLLRDVADVDMLALDLDEIQGDPKSIILDKIRRIKMSGENNWILCEDVSLEFEDCGGMPGPYIKWFSKAVETKRLVDMAYLGGTGRAVARIFIAIRKNSLVKVFEAETRGKIVYPRGDKGFGWDSIFQPDGYDKTLGEMDLCEKEVVFCRKAAMEKVLDYFNL